MPTFVSGPAVASEDYLAGGLYFFVIVRLRLELGDDGAATLIREVVHDSWFEPYVHDDGGLWSGTHLHDVIRWTNPRHGDAVVRVRRTDDDAWLVIAEWDGEGAPRVDAFQRLAPASPRA